MVRAVSIFPWKQQGTNYRNHCPYSEQAFLVLEAARSCLVGWLATSFKEKFLVICHNGSTEGNYQNKIRGCFESYCPIQSRRVNLSYPGSSH